MNGELKTLPASLAEIRSALSGDDEKASREALTALASSARSRLGVTGKPDPGWWEGVAELVMGSETLSAAEIRIELMLLCCQAFLTEGQAGLGMATAERAVSLAERTGNWPLLRRAYSILGTFYSGTRRLDQAIVYYVRALEIAESIKDHVGYCATLANLANARCNAGLLEESITINRHVVELAEGVPMLQSVKMQALHNIANAALMKRSNAVGREYLEKALAETALPTTQEEAYQRVILEHTYAKLLVRLGDIDTAEKRVVLAKEFARQAKSRLAEMQAQLAEALVEAHGGKADIGLTRLKRLLSEAKPTEPVLRDILEAEVECNTKAGRHDDAKRYQEEYLRQLSKGRREAAVQQLAAVKRAFREQGKVSDDDLSILPDEVRERLRDRDKEYWRSFREQLETIAVLAEMRDDATGEHAFRVGRLAGLLARRLGYSRERVAEVDLAARLHDIGKLVVPDAVLLSEDRLTPAEMEVMRRHTTDGAIILQDATNSPHFKLSAEIALFHHEWWNGEGYPRGVRGSDIPEESRIAALADVFDALTHDRPYKTAWTLEASVKQIGELAGKQFDPKYCEEFLRLIEDLNRDHRGNLDAYLGAEARRLPLVNANRLIDRIVRSAGKGLKEPSTIRI